MKQNNAIFKSIFSFLLIGCLFSVSFAINVPDGEDIINQLRNEGRTNEEIKVALEDLGLDSDDYSEYLDNESVYISRSCKTYNIEYISSIGAYTSPDLNKREYFVNTEYFKRYVDSKNSQKYGCPTNQGRINTFYDDTSNSFDRYVAPNGKIYFITNQNGLYTSNELNNPRKFSTINELKNYIRDRNSLTYMGK